MCAADSVRIDMPGEVRRILDTLHAAGYEAYAVGGCVRDSLLGITPHDWDVTTSARPQEVKRLFRRTVDTGIAHGTVTVMLHGTGYEVTTYRIDGDYEDGRHPREVSYTLRLLEDLKRRDFTINAMAYNETDGLVDAFSGQQDLKEGVIRCVGDPDARFGEDALRILRAVRFAGQLGFRIEEATLAAIKNHAKRLGLVSPERIRTEWDKLLVSAHPELIRTAWETGITAVILPEYDRLMDCPQNNPHHFTNVGEHTLLAVCAVPADLILRLTMLLHDVAKPECKSTDKRGRDHFYGHAEKGAVCAEKILRRLRYDNATIRAVTELVRWHDRPIPSTAEGVRRAASALGRERFVQLLKVKKADVLAQSDYKRESKLETIAAYESLYEEICAGKDPLAVSELAVTGKDLIGAGMKPGSEMGRTLQDMLDLVLRDPGLNTREELMKRAERRGRNGSHDT